MHLKTARKTVKDLPRLLTVSTGVWLEIKTDKQVSAIIRLKSNWSEPEGVSLSLDQEGTRLFAFFRGELHRSTLMAIVKTQSVDGVTQISDVALDVPPEHFSYELSRLSQQEHMTVVRAEHHALFINSPSHQELISNADLNRYCSQIMIERNKLPVNMQLFNLNTGDLALRQQGSNPLNFVYHEMKSIMGDLTKTPNEERVELKYMLVTPSENEMSLVEHFDVIAPLADAIDDIVRLSMRVSNLELDNLEQITITWHLAGVFVQFLIYKRMTKTV